MIELFTSQGCSSCPPADALLSELAEREGILALSFNVDYWDMLGWKDTLASHDNTERQRSYATARGDGQVYTPQLVIDGRMHLVGSDRAGIEAALDDVDGLKVPVTLALSRDSLAIEVGAAPHGAPHAMVWLVMYEPSVSVTIDRGENSGKTIAYSNVVRKLRPVAMWKGEPMTVEVPRSEFKKAKASRCAVLLQSEKDGLPSEILGAATIRAGW